MVPPVLCHIMCVFVFDITKGSCVGKVGGGRDANIVEYSVLYIQVGSSLIIEAIR